MSPDLELAVLNKKSAELAEMVSIRLLYSYICDKIRCNIQPQIIDYYQTEYICRRDKLLQPFILLLVLLLGPGHI